MNGNVASSGARDAPPILIHLTYAPYALEAILSERMLRASSPLGAVHRHDQLGPSQTAISLSEIDLTEVHRLASRHGAYGLAFQRSWVQQRGGAPVWYLPRGSAVQQRLFELVKQLAFRRDPDLSHFLWEFTPFIDYPKDSDAPGGTYDWRWEREWRVAGDLEFQHKDIVVLFAPSSQHGAIREAWGRATASDAPIPPLVDVTWSLDAQISAITTAVTTDITTDITSDEHASGSADTNTVRAADEPRSPWRMPPGEPPDDPAFDDLPDYERDLIDPDAAWLEEEADPELKVMRELEADEDFDLTSLAWFEAEIFEPDGESDEDDGGVSPEGSDDDLELADHLDEWQVWLGVAERDDT